MVTVFFSYSHKDEALRDQLEIHLSVLKRQGTISVWHDRRILAGKEFDGEISEFLEKANIILLLASPHFLASTYINDVEIKRALARHRDGLAVVIPVILHPCDWKHTPLGNLLACPKDGVPVSKHPNMDEAFLDITNRIREVAEDISTQIHPSDADQPETIVTAQTHSDRSSNLRVRREFTDHERDEFLDQAFPYIASYFENSLYELEKRTSGTDTKFMRRDSSRFSAAVYMNGEKKASCSVWLGNDIGLGHGICFSHGDSTYNTGFNESLSVDSDGHSLGIKPLGMAMRSHDFEGLLTQQGAAEYLWSLFVEQLQ